MCVAVTASSDGAFAAAGVEPSSLSETAMEHMSSAKPTTAANRCMTCRRKVGLTVFWCRCGGTFCGGVHHYSESQDKILGRAGLQA